MESSPISSVRRDETYPNSFPRTPPYTPNATCQHFIRSDSPASVHSIHPLETISPKKPKEQTASQDSVKVEELHEGDAGYTTDTELIYPDELEEPKSPTHSHASFTSSSSSSSDAESEIAQHFSRLGCADGRETPLERRRRLQRKRKRAESRVFKRTHSQSVHGEAEMSDVDGMPDQDRNSSARRLRRRIRGPSGVQVLFDDVQRTPPPSRGCDAAAVAPVFGPTGSRDSAALSTFDSVDDDMDVDESSK